jgi:hypothetical protein
MKKIAVVFVLILTFCGCDNSSEPSLEERFSCKVDGKLFVAAEDSKNAISGSKNLTIDYYDFGDSNSYFLSIVATEENNDGFAIACDSVLKVNVQYPILTKVTFYQKGSTYYNALNGSLTVLEIDTASKRMKGIFNFTAKEEGGSKVIAVTEGKFNSAYISRD